MSETLPIAQPNASGQPPDARAHLLGVEPAELEALLEPLGEKRFRAAQILEWIYRNGAENFDSMSNLSKPLRSRLVETAAIFTSRIASESVAGDETTKLLLEWPDRCAAETVWIPTDDRNTACLSSQVGCPVGCRFCASGLDGVERNLTAGEIVEQALRVRQRVDARAPEDKPHRSATGERLSNIVLMGMGEPLANYRNVMKAIRILNAPWGAGIGARKITLSTVGLPRQIRDLAGEGLQINLALSLHAPEESLRQELIPWRTHVPLDEILDACWYYFETTGREVTFEYVLLAGVNDRPAHATRLASIARRLRANVNLLRYNPVAGTPYERPTSEAAFAFQAALRERGVNAHIRTSRGVDADAACGQLRRRARQSEPPS